MVCTKMVINDKFSVKINTVNGGMYTPQAFEHFFWHCHKIATKNKWIVDTVINYELRPMGGRLVKTKHYGWYLRWDKESDYTAFLLKWT